MNSPPSLDTIDDSINAVIYKITCQPATRHTQLTSLHCLVYKKYNIILIVATGFSKSAILFASLLLTNKITMLIVLLTKLAENQCDDIAKNIEGANPVQIDTNIYLKVNQMQSAKQMGFKLTKFLESQDIKASTSRPLYPWHPQFRTDDQCPF